MSLQTLLLQLSKNKEIDVSCYAIDKKLTINIKESYWSKTLDVFKIDLTKKLDESPFKKYEDAETQKNKDFQLKMFSFRKLNNLTQKEVAEKLNVKRQSIQRWEKLKMELPTERRTQLETIYLTKNT